MYSNAKHLFVENKLVSNLIGMLHLLWVSVPINIFINRPKQVIFKRVVYFVLRALHLEYCTKWPCRVEKLFCKATSSSNDAFRQAFYDWRGRTWGQNSLGGVCSLIGVVLRNKWTLIMGNKPVLLHCWAAAFSVSCTRRHVQQQKTF